MLLHSAQTGRPRRLDSGLKARADKCMCKGGEPGQTRLDGELPGGRKK